MFHTLNKTCKEDEQMAQKLHDFRVGVRELASKLRPPEALAVLTMSVAEVMMLASEDEKEYMAIVESMHSFFRSLPEITAALEEMMGNEDSVKH
jgi:hypothetical protein